jgi:4-coumarate--CoA ligase
MCFGKWLCEAVRLIMQAYWTRKLANPGYILDELVYHIKDSRPKILVIGKPVFDVAKKAAIECGITDGNIYMMEEEAHEQYRSIWSLVGKEELEPRHLSPQEAKQRTAFMCYSSGTTGKAKGGTVLLVILTTIILTNPQCTMQWRLLIIISHPWSCK